MGGVLLALAGYVYHAARDRPHNLVFSLLYALSGLKSLSEGLLPMADALHARAPAFPDPVLWFRLGLLAAFFMLPLLLLFVLLFPRPRRVLQSFPALRVLLFVPSLFLAALVVVPNHVGLARVITGFNAASLLATFAAVLLLAQGYRTTQDAVERTRAAYVLGAFTTTILANLLIVLLQFARSPWTQFFLEWITPLVELVVAAVVGYAIVKYQLLGIELKVKRGTRYAMTGSSMVVVFFVANNTFQKVVEPVFAFTQLSFLLAALAATFVFYPIQRYAGKFTNRLFPETNATPQAYKLHRGREVYHAQVAYVLRDSIVTERERRLLEHLRLQLGLSREDATGVEGDVERALVAEGRPPRAALAAAVAADASLPPNP